MKMTRDAIAMQLGVPRDAIYLGSIHLSEEYGTAMERTGHPVSWFINQINLRWSSTNTLYKDKAHAAHSAMSTFIYYGRERYDEFIKEMEQAQ